MFDRDNLTDFEKLLFAQTFIKELKKELSEANVKNGVLLSEIDELKDIIAKSKDTNRILSYKAQMKSYQKKLKLSSDEQKYKKLYEKCFAESIALKATIGG
jgi:predicted DNA-binding protein YlxM (UPF0122 family)